MNPVLATTIGVVVLVLGLAASIGLHEIGHLVPAKAFGVKVTQYMIGFGPTLFSRRRGETEYGVKAVPLGGYIRMIGMYAPAADGTARQGSTSAFGALADDARALAAEEVGPGEEHRTFYRLPVRKRVVVMLGGPVMNLLLATVFLGIFLTTSGLPQTTTKVAYVSACVVPATDADSSRACTAGDPQTPAAAAGLKTGDVIVSVAGVPARGDWTRVQKAIRASAGRTVPVVVERGGQRRVLQAPIIANTVARTTADGTPVTDSSGTVLTTRAGYLGVSPAQALVAQPVSAVPGFVASSTWSTAKVVLALPQRMVGVAQAAFGHGERDPNGPIGLVGVGRLSGEVASSSVFTSTGQRVEAMLSILGSLNLALFVFNLVPLLPLDGGHVAGALWEAVRRRVAAWKGRPDPGPFDLARLLPVTYVVSALLVSMSVLLLYADIVRPIKLG
jgi:membrane-associated protease RseP (regulator of RpoE activity)